VAAAVDTVEAEVRELVRRRGLDPVQDRLAVRRLVDDVVAEYDERTLTSSVPPLSDPFVAARSVYDAVAGFGPLQRHLDDPTVEEVWINEPGRVFVARRGRSELTTTILTAAQVSDLVEKMLKSTGRRVDLSTPFVDAMLPDGSRLHVVIPDITRRHMSVNIRKFVLSAVSMDELVELGTVTSRAARFLEAAVVAGLNVIVAGGTQAGKTTLLNCLASAIPGRERVVTCEEVFELALPLPDVVAMQTRQPNLEGSGEIRLRRLVVEALRMRPDRILVGEVRQEECPRRCAHQQGPRASSDRDGPLCVCPGRHHRPGRSPARPGAATPRLVRLGSWPGVVRGLCRQVPTGCALAAPPDHPAPAMRQSGPAAHGRQQAAPAIDQPQRRCPRRDSLALQDRQGAS